MNPFVVGLLINSALYLSGCFIAGLVTGNPWAWKMSLATMGVTYLCYWFQADTALPPLVVKFTVILSICMGAAAGIGLLVKA